MTHCIKYFCLDRLCKTLKRGSIPTLNLPNKSLDDLKPLTSRRVIEKKELTPSKVYKDISDLQSKVSKLVLKGWFKKPGKNTFTLEYFDGKHALPLYSLRIDHDLRFEVSSFGWLLPAIMTFTLNINTLCALYQFHH